MNKNEQEILLDFDEVLKRMAEETPEMPEDFHDAWVHAVKTDQNSSENRRKRSVPWIRITSVAAAFVVLFAGTCVVGSQRLARESSVGIPGTGIVSLSANHSINTNAKASAPRQADIEEAVMAEVYEETAVIAEDTAPEYEEAPVMNHESTSVFEALNGEKAFDTAPSDAGSSAGVILRTEDSKTDPGEIREQSFPQRVGSTFISGLKEFGRILSDATVFPIPAIPILVFLAVLIFAIRMIAKKHKKKKTPEN